MDDSLIWLLVPGLLAIYAFVRVSARHKQLSYDIEEYFLAGRKLSTARFALATSTISLLGFIALPHTGLLYRSGFSYGFLALGTIVIALTSALFARRTWNLSRLFNPLTPAQLLGDYYRSNGLRLIVTLIAVLIACCLTILALRLSLDLLQGMLGGLKNGIVPQIHSKISHTVMFTLTALLFIHAAYGGMGAILKLASISGLFLLILLPVAAIIALATLGEGAEFFDRFALLTQKEILIPHLGTGAFFAPSTPAAPLNAPWPGLMVMSSLLAFAGLALSPAVLMSSFTARKGQSMAAQQFFTTAFLTGLLLLTSGVAIAFAPLLAANPGPSASGALSSDILTGNNWSSMAGLEPQMLMRMLHMSFVGTPLVLSLFALALVAGLLVSAAAALLAAGAMISGEFNRHGAKQTAQNLRQKSLTRIAIGLILFVCLILALQKPSDPLPLFLLAGAFGLQLLPALLGLCYFNRLSGPAVQDGALAGLLAVFVTSSLPQGLSAVAGLSLPFGAWPLSIHPALWGLLFNLAGLFVGSLIDRSPGNSEKSQQAQAHQKSWHILPDGKPIMAPGAAKWRWLALVLLVVFIWTLAVPLTNGRIPGPLELSLWGWQFFAWLVGLVLVYVVAYRLQPTFDPERALEGSPDPLNRRFRVKARMRKVEPTPTGANKNDKNI